MKSRSIAFDPTSTEQHEHLCCVWALVRVGRTGVLKGRQSVLARLMAEHPEYQLFWEDRTAGELRATDGINPDLHIILEAIIGEQIEAGSPIEAKIAYEYLKSKMKPHEARHIMVRAFARSICGIIPLGSMDGQALPSGYVEKLAELSGYKK